MMRPLDGLPSIKAKLGVVIVASMGVTVLVVTLAQGAGLPLWLGGVAAGVLSLGMVQFLARGMTSPLREMATAARAMARGDYDRRVTATSHDEVGELARAFNRMAADLAEEDRIRRDLVANVSHELRTPISALHAVLENLVDGVELPDRTALQTALTQVQRLGRLVEQLLDLSRLESGAVPLHRASFEVRDLLEQAAREAAVNHRSRDTKRIGVEVSVEPPSLSAVADAERVHQVVANLVDNALRHSPPGGRVRLAARRNGRGVTITVEDDGPGIPRHETARVFERFYRSDAARAAQDGGAGLGLAIARWIVELHGGTIRVDAARSEGCCVVVELPAATA